MTTRELTELLIKHSGLSEGLYELLIEFQMGFGAVGPAPEHLSPGVMVGVHRIGLSKVSAPSPFSVDASQVNQGAISAKTAKKPLAKAASKRLKK